MNSLQRVMATIEAKKVDRPPVFAILGAYSQKYCNCDMRMLYNDAATYCQGQMEIYRRFGFDLTLLPFDFSIFGEAFGGKVNYFKDQPPNMRNFALKKADEYRGFKFPDPFEAGRFPFYLKTLEILKREIAGEVPIFAVIPGPCSLPALIMGLDNWIEVLLFDADLRERIIDDCIDFLCSWSRNLCESGITSLIMAEPVSGSEILMRTQVEERIVPVWQRFLAELKTPVVFNHGGGKLSHIFDLLARQPEFFAIAISSRDSISEARAAFGPQRLVLGNLDNIRMPVWNKETLYKKSSECFENAGGPFILSNSGGDVPCSTPEENLQAMIEAAQSWQGAVK